MVSKSWKRFDALLPHTSPHHPNLPRSFAQMHNPISSNFYFSFNSMCASITPHSPFSGRACCSYRNHQYPRSPNWSCHPTQVPRNTQSPSVRASSKRSQVSVTQHMPLGSRQLARCNYAATLEGISATSRLQPRKTAMNSEMKSRSTSSRTAQPSTCTG